MKKAIVLCGMLLLTLFSIHAVQGSKGKLKLYSPHITTFKDGDTSVALLGLNVEHFFGGMFSINTDVLVPKSIIPSLSLDLGIHLFPFSSGKLIRGAVEILGGGGLFLSVGGESGVYATCFTGLRYHITEHAGLFFTCRWVFGDFDVTPGIPFMSLGISFNSRRK